MSKLTQLKKHDVILVRENTTLQSIKDDTKTLPTDIHLIEYDENGETKVDAVRAFKMSDIFDAYYDFGIKNVHSITSGYGNIKPKLYTAPKGEDD